MTWTPEKVAAWRWKTGLLADDGGKEPRAGHRQRHGGGGQLLQGAQCGQEGAGPEQRRVQRQIR